MTTVPDTADIVARRRAILTALSSPKTKPELVEDVDASRSTVDRAIETLTDAALVERTGSRYRTTYAGRESLRAYERFLDRLDALQAAQPVLQDLSLEAEIPPEALEGAEVVEATMAAPHAPIERATTLGDGATRLYGTGPAVLPKYIAEISELLEDGDETELVLSKAVVEAFRESYPDAFEQFAGSDNIEIHVTEQALPCLIWIAVKPEETVSGIIVHTENGVRGAIHNDTDAMNEWTREQYRQFKADARPLDGA
ncbi:helix-turn-helix transcriptional regulator [Haloarcula marina]|uniref:helix-turn-helix transcriptional regulator n=1 Tax=Haloarcula marina TaxID=2961574 RepID=UPI0020B78E94|nr:hypothetical protein [Halomicroarcula marina]